MQLPGNGTVDYPSSGSGGVDVAPIDPDALIDYLLLWADWLQGDFIATSVWTVLNANEVSSSFTQDRTQLFVDQAEPETQVIMTNTVTTTGGRTEQRTIRAAVLEK